LQKYLNQFSNGKNVAEFHFKCFFFLEKNNLFDNFIYFLKSNAGLAKTSKID